MSDLDVIIIGAPRSGTNMLRDTLIKFDGISTWPCDEINFIWRHGNIRYNSDELHPGLASPAVRQFIRRAFQKIRAARRSSIIIEKTCASSLRVPFINSVLPNSKFIFIVRDGIDASASAIHRWRAPIDVKYSIKKLRYVPIVDIPYYFFRFLYTRAHRFISKDRRIAFWGPQTHDTQELIEKHSLTEYCALQWRRCVDMAEAALDDLPAERVLRVRYEDFVTDPVNNIVKILFFLGKEVPLDIIRDASIGISQNSIGKGRVELGQEMVARIELSVKETLTRHGYY
jgi:hypothetical protein